MDISNFKFIDEEDNEYIIASLANVGNEKYGLMVNINNESDNFISKILEENDAIVLELVEDMELANKVLDNLNIIE